MKKVAVIDSGSGGLNVLSKLFASAHDCQFLYLADEKNAPYGEKSKQNLIKIAKNLVEMLNYSFHPDVIVFACNTLTACAIRAMRMIYPNINFIGCEPAIKPACQKYNPTEVLLLAKDATIKHSALVKKYADMQTLAIKNLPTLIDQNLFDLNSLIPYLRQQILPYSPKAIVLGCTHFEAIKTQISSFCTAELFSSSEGISKRLGSFCAPHGGNDCFFMTTGSGESLPKFFHYLFN